jgi:hypothetical protein
MTSISIHIPISPNISFYSKIKWIRKSLDSLGTPYNKSILHITVSNENNISLDIISNCFEEFKKNRHRYRFYITDSSKFAQYSYGETAGLRFMNIDNSDITIFCDADILFIKPFDELLEETLTYGGIYGVIAHNTPFHNLDKSNEEWWNCLSDMITPNDTINLNHSHSLHPNIKCPPYYNNGFIIGKTDDWKKIADFCYQNFRDIYKLLPESYNRVEGSSNFFSMQISFSLALHKFKIKTHPISNIYNCANDQRLANLLGNKTNDIRIIHYLRGRYINRNLIFVSREQINKFLELNEVDDITGKLQDAVVEIMNKQGYE